MRFGWVLLWVVLAGGGVLGCNGKTGESEAARALEGASDASHGSGASRESTKSAREPATPEESEATAPPRPEPLLEFSSRTVELKANYGRTDTQIVRLHGTLAGSARLAFTAPLAGGPAVSVVAADDTQAQGLRFTLGGTYVGRTFGQVEVATGLPEPATLTVLWSSEVVGNLAIEPTNPFFDLRAPGGRSVVVTITSARDDFHLLGVQIVAGPFDARTVESAAKGHAAVEVRVRPNDGGDDERGWVGTLRLISNDPAEPRKDVPLMAMGPR